MSMVLTAIIVLLATALGWVVGFLFGAVSVSYNQQGSDERFILAGLREYRKMAQRPKDDATVQ